MQTIGNTEIHSYVSGNQEPQKIGNTAIRANEGCFVESYIDLAGKIASLQYLNPHLFFLFRGQSQDHRNRKDHTTIKPSILRPKAAGANPTIGELKERYDALKHNEIRLLEKYKEAKFSGIDILSKRRILRWAILQHYEICPTPLLDVTQSLLVAASFASLEQSPNAYVFAIGVPFMGGAITVSADIGIVSIRLASVCPPKSLRPHLQEGLLLGEFPELEDIGQKSKYQDWEIDFGRRLVAKFVFKPKDFWKNNAPYQSIPKDSLFPNESDPFYRVAASMKRF